MSESAKYITFQVSGKYFALRIECIREMMPMQKLAPWFRGDSPIAGILQSRGKAIPIVDLRRELGLGPRQSSRQERLIVVRSCAGVEFGFTADKVTDCIKVHESDIGDRGVITGHGRPRTILDPDSLAATTFANNSFSMP